MKFPRGLGPLAAAKERIDMLTRRSLLALGGLVGVALPAGHPEAETLAPVMTDDGLFTQSWFLQSFLDLSEDLEEAAGQGKGFAVIWEQRGCPYCRETHLVNFAQPEIQSFVRENFEILQLNMSGSREVTDFDGEALEERELARKNGVAFSPTIQFFPRNPAEAAGKPGRAAEVARMPGYLLPPHFFAMFRFIEDEAYRRMSFRQYLKENPL
jgi:thioredoxin-related protein